MLIDPRHEENPIIIVRAEPDKLDNNYAGLLVIVALLMPALAFSIYSGHGHFLDKKSLQVALAEERSKTPPLKILNTKPVKLQDRMFMDFPPIYIHPWFRNNYRLPSHLF